jgi:predicted nucleotidyltransferase
MRLIHRFAHEVAERFRPDKIVLFGSYACGTPHADSDVDVLVVMPARNQLDQAVKIELACDPPFPLDIIVRTPYNMKWRLAEGDTFLREITTKGKVLYEAVETRYPGDKASKRQAASALRWAGHVRAACRTVLGLRPPQRRRRPAP